MPFFKNVNLGVHEGRLRQIILAAEPGAFDQYACVMWGLQLEVGKPVGLMIPPEKQRIGGATHYICVFGGCLWDYHVCNRPLSEPARSIVLQEDGSMFLQVRDVTELPGLRKFMIDLEKRGGRESRQV
ncbi:MAG: hypothetical protein NVS9B15_25810 [Acidobacteriaceae bacterium]